jgi:hypothetical protein
MKEFELASSLSASSSANTNGYPIGDLREYSIHVIFSSGTLNGSLSLQTSNDNSDWVEIPESVQAVVSGASHLWTVRGAGYKHVRAAWTRTSGTGTLTAKMVVKEFPVQQR